MPKLGNLIAFFWVSLTLTAGFAWWWYGMVFFQAIFVVLVIWFITGIASVAFELSVKPSDDTAPKWLRISGQLFRGTSVAMAALLMIVVLVNICREHSG